MSVRFQLDLAWSQVSLFEAGLADPFNDWTEGHLTQGFSWRPGSVSFKVPAKQGRCDVTVELIDVVSVDPDAQWAIVVPFTTFGGQLEVSTMQADQLIELPSGTFTVLYQTGLYDDGQPWVRFGFQQTPSRMRVEPTILRGGHEVFADVHGLLMDAEPAVA